jgi:hypothetical protein
MDVKLDPLTDQLQDLPTRVAHGDAAGQIGHIGAETGLTFFDDDQEFHGPS